MRGYSMQSKKEKVSKISVYVHSCYEVLNKNCNLFNMVGDVSIYDFLCMMKSFDNYAGDENIELISGDKAKAKHCDAIILIDAPLQMEDFEFFRCLNIPLFLLVWESPIINKRNHEPDFLKNFSGVFTYNVDAVPSGVLAQHVGYAVNKQGYRLPSPTSFLCCISGNRYSLDSGELYSKRREVVRDLERLKVDFDLYGQGWNRFIPPNNILEKIYNRFLSDKLNYNPYPSWRGTVAVKEDIYARYEFAICFENTLNEVGYVSEKVLSCIAAGCMPIYLGYRSLSDIIPSSLFLDFNLFSSVAEMLDYLDLNKDHLLQEFHKVRAEFIFSSSSIFSQDYFNKVLVKTIKDVLACR